MPTNTQQVAALEAHAVPPDLECVPGQMTALLALVAQYLSVVSVTSEIDQQSGNSIAQQALETANIALTNAQQAIDSIPQTRSSQTPIAIAAGDSALNISFSVPMPDTNYEFRGTYYGTAAYPTLFFGFHVEESTRTVNGCTIRFSNTPSNFKFAWVAQQLL